MEPNAETPEVRRRRLRFRCWHRGMREVDLLLGSFADDRIDKLDAEALDDLERLLEVPDPNIHAWLVGRTQPAEEHTTPLMELLLAHVERFRLTARPSGDS